MRIYEYANMGMKLIIDNFFFANFVWNLASPAYRQAGLRLKEHSYKSFSQIFAEKKRRFTQKETRQFTSWPDRIISPLQGLDCTISANCRAVFLMSNEQLWNYE